MQQDPLENFKTELNPKKRIKKTLIIVIVSSVLLILLLILGSIILFTIKTTKNKQNSNNGNTNLAVQNQNSSQVSQDDQLKSKIIQIINEKYPSPKFSYNGLEIKKKTNNNKKIIVEINADQEVKDNNLSLEVNQLTSEIFQTVFQNDQKIQDVYIWYYTNKTDRYGQKSKWVGLSYFMTRIIYSTIEWQNFDSNKVCQFLQEKNKNNPQDAFCNETEIIKNE